MIYIYIYYVYANETNLLLLYILGRWNWLFSTVRERAATWRFLTSILAGTTGRDRCDSLPSRARTTSEGQPTAVVLSHPRGAHIMSHVPRPHSMCGRGLSYSPPIASMPISPVSDVCSSDSAGSSPSMDDCGENILEEGTVLRYGHSLTPDEPIILDKKGDDYTSWSTSHSHLKYSPNFKSHSPSQVSVTTLASER